MEIKERPEDMNPGDWIPAVKLVDKFLEEFPEHSHNREHLLRYAEDMGLVRKRFPGELGDPTQN